MYYAGDIMVTHHIKTHTDYNGFRLECEFCVFMCFLLLRSLISLFHQYGTGAVPVPTPNFELFKAF